MSVACAAEVSGLFLWEGDTSNKLFEWTGRHQRSASTIQSLPATQGQRWQGWQVLLRCLYVMYHLSNIVCLKDFP
jgi:hypothetical protein